MCIKYHKEYFEFDLVYRNQNKRGQYSIQTTAFYKQYIYIFIYKFI